MNLRIEQCKIKASQGGKQWYINEIWDIFCSQHLRSENHVLGHQSTLKIKYESLEDLGTYKMKKHE